MLGGLATIVVLVTYQYRAKRPLLTIRTMLTSSIPVAGIVVAIELTAISLIRKRFLSVSLRTSLLQVALGGALIVAAGVVLGSA